MQNSLPMDLNPPIKSFTFWANYLGILSGMGYDLNGFLYNHYLISFYGIAANHLGYLGGLKAKSLFIHRRFSMPTSCQIGYIKGKIDSQRYVTLQLNAKHLSNVSFDRDWHHDWMIYGYDDIQECFFAVGFVVNTNCHAFDYTQINISYTDLLLALPSNGKHICSNYSSYLPKNFRLPEFSMKKLKADAFLYSYSIMPFLFNAQIYPRFAWVFRRKWENNENSIDLRPLKVLQEHKLLLLQMMRDLVPNSIAATEFASIVNIANGIQMTALKYNMTKRNKQKAIDTICEALLKLRAEEPRIMRQFYRKLKILDKK